MVSALVFQGKSSFETCLEKKHKKPVVVGLQTLNWIPPSVVKVNLGKKLPTKLLVMVPVKTRYSGRNHKS